jgi:hypothetical protein
MKHAKVREPAEQTMQRFLSRLTYQIRRIVRHHLYNDMAQLLHQACETEDHIFSLFTSYCDKIMFFVMDIVSWTAYCWLMFTHASILVAWCGLGSTHAMAWCGQSLAPLRLSFRLRLVSGKIGGSGFVSSNSENISCATFLKHKNSRK